jgi:hypothetical protein
MSLDAAKLVKQLQFYLSDANLRNDKFMLSQLDASADGFISLSLFLTFNRVKKMVSSVSEIVSALETCPVTELELNHDKTCIKRKVEFKKVDIDLINQKSVYYKNLPENVELEELEALFTLYKAVLVKKIKRNQKYFGRVVVEFASVEDAKNALGVKYNEIDLNGEILAERVARKAAEYASKSNEEKGKNKRRNHSHLNATKKAKTRE